MLTQTKALSFLISTLTPVIFLSLITGCMNSRLSTNLSINASPSPGASSSVPTLTIGRIPPPVTVAGAAATAPTFQIFFDTSQSNAYLTDYCSVSSGAATGMDRSCMCQFNWSEANSATGTLITIPRMVQTAATLVQGSKLECLAPTPYLLEIPDQTVLRIKVIPGPMSSVSFNVPTYNFTKVSNTQSGSFQDQQGRVFDNILRYSCYESYRRGMGFISKTAKATDGNTNETHTYPLASQFCVQKANGAAGGGSSESEECSSLPAVSYSAQAYYYDLYIRDADKGYINRYNDRYTCPQINEPLIPNSGTGQYWPLDRTFALARDRSDIFSVGVEANTKLSAGEGDPASVGSSCTVKDNSNPGGTTGGSVDTLVQGCLGFAAKINSDGTCPSITDTLGRQVPTYRLRRFVTLYPKIFDTNGNITGGNQATNMIYVVDRPVKYASADPRRPFTMRGPKPCPFSYYDAKMVTGIADGAYPNGTKPGYVATNNSAWNGTNVDGIEFPNSDLTTNGAMSCAATIPLFSADRSVVTLGTVHTYNPAMKRVYIRPQKAWAPHYEEDLDFKACAPLSEPFLDPPLHFAKDPTTGNVAWCAESYPTQNDNIPEIDLKNALGNFYARVAPFTSHVSKNSTSGECIATTKLSSLTDKYPNYSSATQSCNGAGFACHPAALGWDLGYVSGVATVIGSHKTCDRTTTPPRGTWGRFPLLATAKNVESAIGSDTTYQCTITWDNNTGKAGKLTPSAGCCGAATDVTTGMAVDSAATPATAHLEPDRKCLSPDY